MEREVKPTKITAAGRSIGNSNGKVSDGDKAYPNIKEKELWNLVKPIVIFSTLLVTLNYESTRRCHSWLSERKNAIIAPARLQMRFTQSFVSHRAP